MQRLKVLGPPGTGKTEYLLQQLELELQKVRPNRIAFLTFTRAARQEALSRVNRSQAELPFLRTIHSICYHQLGIRQGQIVKPRDLRSFGVAIGARMTGNLIDPWLAEEAGLSWETPTKADRLLQLNHLGRHNETKLKEALQTAPLDLDYNYSKWFTQAYRDWKSMENLVDYTDLLMEYLSLGKPLPIDVMFVDEAQDLSKLQWDVVRKLGAEAERWYLAGDDDQAIYTWAGAAAELFIDQPCESSKVLDQSYRLPRVVHELSQRLISQVQYRLEKQFRPRDVEGVLQPLGYLDEPSLDQETLILFRNHHRGQQLAQQLVVGEIPFLGAGSVLSDPEVRRALRGWYKLCNDEDISPIEGLALRGVSSPKFLTAGQPKKFTGPVKWHQVFFGKPQMAEFAAILHRLPRLDYLERVIFRHGFSALLFPKATLMSIHQSKGRQAHTVVLDTELASKTNQGLLDNPDDEHRVWYVGVTRAKERLLTLIPMSPQHYPL